LFKSIGAVAAAAAVSTTVPVEAKTRTYLDAPLPADLADESPNAGPINDEVEIEKTDLILSSPDGTVHRVVPSDQKMKVLIAAELAAHRARRAQQKEWLEAASLPDKEWHEWINKK
jgi:hypothetical protein